MYILITLILVKCREYLSYKDFRCRKNLSKKKNNNLSMIVKVNVWKTL